MDTLKTTENSRLASSLALAVDGEEAFIRAFFHEFLIGPLYVPSRFQHYPLTNQPVYPNDFMTVLGVQDVDRVVVPCFVNPEHIVGWAGTPFTFRAYSGEKLLELLPPDWWLVVGLGQSSSKELSPWELDTLRAGDDGIEAIVREHLLDELESIPTLDVQQLTPERLAKILPQIEDAFASIEEIEKIYIGTMIDSEQAQDQKTQAFEQYIVGLSIPNQPFETHTRLRDEFTARLSQFAIGEAAIRVVTGESVERSLSLSLFLHHQPIFER